MASTENTKHLHPISPSDTKAWERYTRSELVLMLGKSALESHSSHKGEIIIDLTAIRVSREEGHFYSLYIA